MRIALLLLAALAILPTASAAGEILVTLDGETEPFLLREQRATIRVDVDCGLFTGVPPMVRVELAVEDAPYWLTALPDPRELATSPTECPGARRTLESLLKMFMHPVDTPPLADEPTTMTIRATAEDAQGARFEATATLDVRAGLFGVMRVTPGSWPASVRPGDVLTITHEIANGWNAPAIVEWTPDAGAAALNIQPHTVRVDANADGIASFQLTIPDTAPSGPFDLALDWKARRDGPQAEPLGNGTRGITLFVDGPGRGIVPASPSRMIREDAPGPGLFALLAVAAVALALRPSRG